MITGTEPIEGVRPGTYPDESLIGKINGCDVVHHDDDPSLVGEVSSLDGLNHRRHSRWEVHGCCCCGKPIGGYKTNSWFSLCAECLIDVMDYSKDKK